MTGIFNDNGNGERSVTPYFDLQDGSGERQPTAVYVNLQDGNGEVQIWPTGSSGIMVDGFEDGDITEYTSTTEASVTTGAAHDGTYGLYIADAGASGMIYCSPSVSTPPNGEWLDPGSTFEFWVKPVDSTANNLIFFYGVAQANTYYQYEVRLFPGSNEVSLYADNNGSHTLIGQDTAAGWADGAWHRVQVGYDTDGAGTHTIAMYDASGNTLVAFSGTYTAHQSGDATWPTDTYKGWAFYSYGDPFHFDSLVKT